MFDALIVGGGVAGFAAATALCASGARVLVLEARPVLGGRASVVRDPHTGERLDNGQHVLMGCYDETFALLKRVGAMDRVRLQDGLSVRQIDRNGQHSTLKLPPLPAPLHLLAGVLAWEALNWAERISILRIGRTLTRAGGAQVSPAWTVLDWLRAHHQATRLIDLFWEPLALAALNQPTAVASAASFIAVLTRMFGPTPDRAALVLPAVPLDELYAEPARTWLEARGSAVRTNSPAQIVVAHDTVRGVVVHGELIEARTVISTVPWFAFGRLFAAMPPSLGTIADAAAHTASSPILTVNLWFDAPVMDDALVGLPGRVFQWVFDKRQVFGAAASHLSLVSSGAEAIVALSNEAIIDIAHREVAAALPRARAAKLRHASAVRERHATFSLAPGQPSRPDAITPVRGLLLGGDWTNTGLPATIESAAQSGHVAAGLVA